MNLHIEFLALLHLLVFAGVALHLLSRPREPLSTLLWLFITFSFPFLGLFLYMALGINRVQTPGPNPGRRQTLRERRQERQRRRLDRQLNETHLAYRQLDPSLPPCAQPLNTILQRSPITPPLTTGNSLHLYTSGAAAIQAILAAIHTARHHIHIQFYIIANDPTGRQLMDALAERARAGIHIRVLYDTVGSAPSHLSRFFSPYRRIPNLHIHGFTHTNLARFTLQANIRNHRKIAVFDGQTAFTGGVNIHKDYFPTPLAEPIRDIHLRLRGPAVSDLQATFLRDWHHISPSSPDLPPDRTFPPPLIEGQTLVRVVNNGPTDDEIDIGANTFTTAIQSATRQILILTPYFVPTPELTRALIIAALKGIDTRILLPRENNHPLIANASRSYYQRLLQAGVRIFERQPPFIHTKAILIDSILSIIGSSNLDPRSLNLNYETNLIIPDPPFAAILKHHLLSEFAHADEIHLPAWRRRPLHRRIIENACNLLQPNL